MLIYVFLLPLLFGARLLLGAAQLPNEMGRKKKVAKTEKALGMEPRMPPPEERRKRAVDKLRAKHANKHNKVEEEEKRLETLYREWEQRREDLEKTKEFEECQRLTAVNVHSISNFYVGYDAEYGTRKLSPILLQKMATAANYLTAEKREMVYGKEGFMNLGYMVEGTLPIYGAWPGGRALTKKEKQNVDSAKDCLNMRRAEIDAHTKPRDHPSDFENDFVLQKCFAAVDKLRGTPMATWIPEESVDKKAWIWPYFGIGQRRDPDAGAWTKVRPIANEKLRSRAYYQLGVACPDRNLFQCYNPETGHYQYGKMSCLSFGNIHSVYAFCGSISELLSAFFSDVVEIPTAVYVGDLIFLSSPGLTELHMRYFRKFLALMGLAVAPEKCEFVEYGGTLEVLGILFTVLEDRIIVRLPEPKVAQLSERIGAIREALRDLHDENFKGQPVDLGDLRGRFEEVVFKQDLEAAHAVLHADIVASIYGIAKDATARIKMLDALGQKYNTHFPYTERLVASAIDAVAEQVQKVYKQLGWLTEEQLQLKPLEKAAKKPNNHYNGIRKKLELWVEAEKDSKRPRAPNVVPHKYSQMWPMSDQVTLFIFPEEAHHCMAKGGIECRNSKFRVWLYYCYNYFPGAYFVPHEVDTVEKYELLRSHHPNITRSMLQLFGQFLYERGITAPETYVALVGQRMRSLCCLEKNNPQAAQLQTLTLDNLTRYKTKFTPDKAAPPDLSRVSDLTLREQATCGMWTCTGLRKDSFCSIRADMVFLVCPERKFVRATVPCIKSIPTPGEVFCVFIPADVFFVDVFPVEPEECDRIALKLKTTSHGVRRALALYLRRLAGEIGLMPSPDLEESKHYLKYKSKINEFFGWSENSTQWISEYSKDIAFHLNTAFWVHPLVEQWFLSDL
eukprot:g4289.t1